VGAAVATVIFAFIGAGRRKKLEAEALERAEARDSINTLLADADAIEADFRAGALAPESFRRSLNDKVNAATRMLRTRMHGMDVFFVKYAEMQVQEYLRVLENPERRKMEAAVAEQTATASPEPAAPPSGIALGGGADALWSPPAPAHRAAPAPPVTVEPPEAETPDDSFEPPVETRSAPPAPLPVPEAADPVLGEDAGDLFEPPTVETVKMPALEPAAPPPPAPISEPAPQAVSKPVLGEPVLGEPVLGEPVLGELEDIEFDLSVVAPAAPVAPAPPPASRPAPAADAWSDQSIEEFEAAFAQFEEGPAAPAEEAAETGRFQAVNDAGVPEAPASLPPAPPAPAIHDDHTLTETSSIDKAAIMSALAAAQQGQTPQPPQSVHKQASVQPSQQAEVKEPQPDQQGITGDDVVDVIDSFFNLK
jgi:hypothetical protein